MDADTRVYTIAIGDQYERLANLTVPLMERHMGRTVEVITTGDPWTAKLSLLSDRDTLFIDVDVVMLSWDAEGIRPGLLNLCPFGAPPAIFRMAHPSVARWYNTGVWFATASSASLFASAREILRSGARFDGLPSNLHEETALNLAIDDAGHEVHALSSRYNHYWCDQLQPNTHCVHYAGMSIDHKLDLIGKHVAKLNG